MTSIVCGQNNVALGKTYQVSQSPYTFHESYKDSYGPDAFSQTHKWYRGELTDGAYGGNYWDKGWIHFAQSGLYSITIDLLGIYDISQVKVTALGGGGYDQYFPDKIAVYGLAKPGPVMVYEKFCETMESDNQKWKFLGAVSNTMGEDGKSHIGHTFEISTTATVRLLKIVVTGHSSTFLSEIEVYSHDEPLLEDKEIELVKFPAEGRNIFFPINIKTTDTPINRKGYLLGVHSGMSDSPYSQRLVMADIIKDRPAGMQSEGTAILKQAGIRSLRFYDAYWVNYRSHIEAVKVVNAMTDRNYPIPPDENHYPFPFYKEIIDYCAANNLTCVMVLDTIYYDSVEDRVYSTKQVANGVDQPGGLLHKAALRNAVPIAQYHHDRGYSNRLILEIGNEGIGYGGDPNPSAQEYARIIRAYAFVINTTAPEVEVAIYQWPGMEIYSLVATEAGKFIDHAVIHPYSPRFSPGTVWQDIDKAAAALDAAGLNHVRVLITEYSISLWDESSRTYRMGLEQCRSELAMASHPRVSGMYEHNLFGSAKVTHSNGNFWSLIPSYENYKIHGHSADKNPELGSRFVVLPSGMTGNMLDKVMHGELIKYWPGTNCKISGLMSQEGKQRRILLLNSAHDSIMLRWKGIGDYQVQKEYQLVSEGEKLSESIKQPWYINSTLTGRFPTDIAARSMLFLEILGK